MRGKICSARAIGWGNCCCAAGCTMTAGIGRADIGSGSRVWNGRSRPSGSSSTTTNSQSITSSRDSASWMPSHRDCGVGALSGTGRLVALFPRDRYVDGDHDPGRAARLSPLSVRPALMAYRRARVRRRLEWRETSPRSDHPDRECVGAAAAGRGGLGLSTPSWCGGGIDAPPERAAAAGHRDRGQSAAAAVSPVSATRRAAEVGPENRGSDRAETGGVCVGDAPASAADDALIDRRRTGPGPMKDVPSAPE
jgi:hypothetical protein